MKKIEKKTEKRIEKRLEKKNSLLLNKNFCVFSALTSTIKIKNKNITTMPPTYTVAKTNPKNSNPKKIIKKETNKNTKTEDNKIYTVLLKRNKLLKQKHKKIDKININNIVNISFK